MEWYWYLTTSVCRRENLKHIAAFVKRRFGRFLERSSRRGSFVMWSSLFSLLVCSVVYRIALGAGGRGRTGDRGDKRIHSERVASLRARQTDPAVDQPREESRIRSSTRDRLPTS